ncbi:MAG: hypothetical protein HY951_04480 [Bacteroidia bacterium]|nr:hypothetical protein [Bacteroidia bacterium]
MKKLHDFTNEKLNVIQLMDAKEMIEIKGGECTVCDCLGGTCVVGTTIGNTCIGKEDFHENTD